MSGEQLDEVFGPRFVVRAGDVALTSSDVQRQARRQHRARTLSDGADMRTPFTFQRGFCVWSYEHQDRRLVLRSWDGLPGSARWTSSSAVSGR
ncbi:hypothetical protein ACIRUY_04350 [Streptomyces erythrochromogenes]|uniref:hypothetical protein n=1 Tax=Streptomyces erythrochromogenes TaxID=285574 RepID=UPI003824715D